MAIFYVFNQHFYCFPILNQELYQGTKISKSQFLLPACLSLLEVNRYVNTVVITISRNTDRVSAVHEKIGYLIKEEYLH